MKEIYANNENGRHPEVQQEMRARQSDACSSPLEGNAAFIKYNNEMLLVLCI